jgi:hypothetical protein
MKLTELEPHFLKPSKTPGSFKHTDDVGCAVGLSLRCPACYWAFARGAASKQEVHTLVLWKPKEDYWAFVGDSYADLSVKSGRAEVAFRSGCRSQFSIKNGKVDFA